MGAYWRVCIIFTALAVTAAAYATPPSAMERAGEMILRHQASDGAIVMGELPAKRSHVIPYCANFAARGLVTSYADTGNVALLDGAKRWTLWYEKHMNADGTIYDFNGAAGAWQPTGECDSTDSYAATYLDLVRCLYEATHDRAWLRARLPAVEKAMSAIRLTLQPNGLTCAKPTWPVMYLMDNTETLAGLRAAEEIGRVVRNTRLQHQAEQAAAKMQQSIAESLWDSTRQVYAVGLDKTGGQVRSPESWYPHVMANLMAIGWLPRSQRHVALLRRLKQKHRAEIPRAVHAEEDLRHLVWWGIAAKGAGDDELLQTVLHELKAFDGRLKSLPKPDVLGHVCWLIANGRDVQAKLPTGREQTLRSRSAKNGRAAGRP